METLVACLSGFLVATSIWLMLSGNLMRFLFGLLLLSNGVNLAILAAGRLTPGAPPLLRQRGGRQPRQPLEPPPPRARPQLWPRPRPRPAARPAAGRPARPPGAAA